MNTDHAPARPRRAQRSRQAGRRIANGAVYVGRPTRCGNHRRVATRTTRTAG